VSFMDSDSVDHTYSFMRNIVGECRCKGVELDEDTRFVLRVLARSDCNEIETNVLEEFVLCVVFVDCKKCGGWHIVDSKKTIAEQIYEYGKERPYHIYGSENSIRQAPPVLPTDKYQVLEFECREGRVHNKNGYDDVIYTTKLCNDLKDKNSNLDE
jgi:hypothetical protein